MDILKMRASSYLLPDPGGEVVRDCLAEIERLNDAILLGSFLLKNVEHVGKDSVDYAASALRSAMTSAQGAEA